MKNFFSKSKIILLLSIILIVTLLYYFRSENIQNEKTKIVTTTKAYTTNIADELIFSGIVKPSSEVVISAKSSGTIASLNVEIGDRVQKGDLIASLDANTEKATVNTLLNNYNALMETKNAVSILYDTRIKSAEESLSQVKQTNFSANTNTKSTSLITGTAILASQINDTLGEMIAMRNGVKNYKSIPYYDNLGATNFSSRAKAENSLAIFQALQSEYQKFYNENIIDKKPSEETISKGLTLSSSLLESAKIALSDIYTMLLYTSVTDNLNGTQLSTYKTTVTNLGTQVENSIASIRGTQSEITQTELGLITIQKEKQTKLSEINNEGTNLEGQISISQTVADNANLKAPFDGIITAKNADLGAVVGFGTPIYYLAQDERVKVVIDIPDQYRNYFTSGDKGFVYIDNDAHNKVEAKITKVYPAVNVNNSKVTLELEFDNSETNFKLGSIVNVSLAKKNSDNSIVIDRDSLISRYGIKYVFVIKEGVVERRLVTVGAQTDSLIEIKKGLAVDETIVKNGGYYLRDGDNVKISSNNEYVTE